MIVCVDFDGTIVDHAFPEIGKPVPGAIKWMQEWDKLGIKIILHTMRSDGQESGDVLTQAVMYLNNNGIMLFGINENPEQHTWTSSPKPYGHVYVDDAAYGCPLNNFQGYNRQCVNWDIVGPSIIALYKASL